MNGSRLGRRLALIAGVVVLLSGFGYLLWGGIGESLVYFLTPTELSAKGSDGYEVPIRLGGMVVPGSVEWDAEALDLRFRLADDQREIEVHSTAAPPQMFREGIGVIVEGKLQKSGVFQATNLMVKHSNEYRPPHEGERPEELYKDLIREGT